MRVWVGLQGGVMYLPKSVDISNKRPHHGDALGACYSVRGCCRCFFHGSLFEHMEIQLGIQ